MQPPLPHGFSRMVRGLAWATIGVAVPLMAWRLGTHSLVRHITPNTLDTPSLAMAVVLCGLSQLLYCDRWHWFLRAVNVPLPWAEVVFTGLFAQLLSAVAIGSVGGDAYRGVVTGRARTGHRAGIIASILADRVAGLYALVCVAAVAATCTSGTGRWQLIRDSSMPVLWSAVALGGMGILAGLFCHLGPLVKWLQRDALPFRTAASLLAALELFHSHRLVFGFGIFTGTVVHISSAASLWCLARGLGLPHPSLAEHFLIGPLATCTALLPLPMAGLGATELVIDELYATAVPNAAAAGLVTALGGRILALAVNAALLAVLFVTSPQTRGAR